MLRVATRVFERQNCSESMIFETRCGRRAAVCDGGSPCPLLAGGGRMTCRWCQDRSCFFSTTLAPDSVSRFSCSAQRACQPRADSAGFCPSLRLSGSPLGVRRDIGIHSHGSHRIAVEDRFRDDAGTGSLKGQRPRSHLVKNDAEREQICATVQFLGPHLLWRHVGCGSQGCPRARELFFGTHRPRRSWRCFQA